MSTCVISQLLKTPEEYLDKTVTLTGWIKTTRSSKEFGFIELNDGTAFKNMQIVFANTLNNFEDICKFSLGTSIEVNGTFINSQGKGQAYEVQADSVTLIGYAALTNPIQKKRHTFEFLRTIPHMRPRTNVFNAVFRVRSKIAYAIHEFFQKNDFTYVHTPIVTTIDAEGAGEMFQVTTLHTDEDRKTKTELFGKKSYLTVSGQLAVEPFCMGFRNVYTFGPTFRAENSNTARHANEFWMIEPEMAFATLEDVVVNAEAMLKHIINVLFEQCPAELDFFNSFVDKELIERLKLIVSSKFETVTYTEAIKLLEKSGKKFEYPVEWGMNLQTEHERYLAEEAFKKPVFVTDYPKDIKAFYMKQNDDGKTVRALDLLVPGVGEIIGGSQREDDLEKLKARMKELGMNVEDYSWYLDVRDFGTFPHAGYGLGFERAIMYLTGMKNIRDVIPYPRTPNAIMF